MFSLSARFRKSRTPGAPGSVYYIIRKDKAERDITGAIRDKDESVISEAKDRIAFDLMTIYCVIETLRKGNDNVTIDDVYDAANKALFKDNPYADQLRGIDGKYPVYDHIAKIAKIFSDKFERHNQIVADGQTSNSTLQGYFAYIIRVYAAEGKPFVKSLRSTLRSLERFLGGRDLPMAKINAEFIIGYSRYIGLRVSPVTVSFYIRTLRIVLKRAESDGLLSRQFVWPERVRTAASRLGCSPKVRTLDIDTIRRLQLIDLSLDSSLDLARDMFIFGFYAQGMEFKDVANLKKENLTGNTLTYKRRQKGNDRRVILGEKAMSIIGKYMNSDHDYLFPILQRRWLHTYASARSEISESLVRIGELLRLPVRLSFSMNIYSWQAIMKTATIAEVIIS